MPPSECILHRICRHAGFKDPMPDIVSPHNFGNREELYLEFLSAVSDVLSVKDIYVDGSRDKRGHVKEFSPAYAEKLKTFVSIAKLMKTHDFDALCREAERKSSEKLSELNAFLYQHRIELGRENQDTDEYYVLRQGPRMDNAVKNNLVQNNILIDAYQRGLIDNSREVSAEHDLRQSGANRGKNLTQSSFYKVHRSNLFPQKMTGDTNK